MLAKYIVSHKSVITILELFFKNIPALLAFFNFFCYFKMKNYLKYINISALFCVFQFF